jgi:hypothetical protein
MPRRSLSDLRYAVRRRARRGRYALEDLRYAIRRSTRRLSSGAGRRWSGLTLRTRNRIAAGLAAAVVVLALVVFAVPNLPCQLPGGEQCQPDDEAIALVPGDSPAYVHLDTDPDSEQYERAASVAERVPALAEQLLARLPAPRATGVDYRREVGPWLGGEAALALVPAGGGPPRPTLLLEIGDQDGAARFVRRVAGEESGEAHRGVDVVGGSGAVAATVGDFVVVGPDAEVKSVIDTDAGGPTLADAGWVDELRDGFPDLRLAELLVSAEGADELFAPGAPLGSFEVFVNARATRGAGAALVATEDGLELDIDSLLDSERVDAAPGFFGAFPGFEPALGDEPSENALAYVALGDPARSVADLFAQATAESPGLAAGFEEFAKRLRNAGDVSLERELLPLLSSQAAVWVEPRGGRGEAEAPEAELPGAEGAPSQEPAATPSLGTPFVTMVVDEVDSEQATRALARLQRPIAKALDAGRNLQAPVIDQQRIDGVEAQSLRVSPAVDLTYALIDGRLVISTDPAGVRQVLGDDSNLEGSDRFDGATDGLPDDDLSAAGYLNVEGLLQLAERAGLGADPAYATFREELRRMEALGVAVRQDDDELDTELRLTIGGD